MVKVEIYIIYNFVVGISLAKTGHKNWFYLRGLVHRTKYMQYKSGVCHVVDARSSCL